MRAPRTQHALSDLPINPWYRMEWNGMEWDGLEWNGIEWTGMGWNVMKIGNKGWRG